MDTNYGLIGSKIRHYRESKRLSQEEFADKIDISERHLRNIEYGKKGPSVSLLISIANALNITADELLADYLNNSAKKQNTELLTVFSDCTPTEKTILMDMLKHMKALLLENGI